MRAPAAVAPLRRGPAPSPLRAPNRQGRGLSRGRAPPPNAAPRPRRVPPPPSPRRPPEPCIRRAHTIGPAVGQFTAALLSGTFPWAHLRQAQKLLRLAERYGAPRLNAACARALAFELLDVRRVESILRTALEREPAPEERVQLLPLPARFARPPHSFVHPQPEKEDSDGDRP